MKRLKLLFFLISLVLLSSACSETSLSSTDTGSQSLPPASTSATLATGDFQEFPLPKANAGLMRPAIDHEGRLWFGEMTHNYLTSFDPRTRTFRQMTPPHGHSGIMGIEVAPDDTVWYAEQYANYIGRYSPSTGRFQIFPLPTFTAPDPGNPGKTLTLPEAPNDLALDAHGNVWFTELNADELARLDPRTGHVQHYSLSASKSVQTLNPYGITIDPQGSVWFTESSNNRLGRLDPATGHIELFTAPVTGITLMEVASDSSGTIWITSFSANLLLSFNPHTRTFTSYYAPTPGSHANGIYGLAATPGGDIWIADSAANAIARLDIAHKRFIYYQIPTPDSFPLGIVMGGDHTLWFTETGSNKIGSLRP